MIPREACHGCHDDFYNRSDSRCWSAKTGIVKLRYRIHYLTAPTVKGAIEKVRAPSCYRQVNAMFYFDNLPDFVKPSDLKRASPAPDPCEECGVLGRCRHKSASSREP